VRITDMPRRSIIVPEPTAITVLKHLVYEVSPDNQFAGNRVFRLKYCFRMSGSEFLEIEFILTKINIGIRQNSVGHFPVRDQFIEIRNVMGKPGKNRNGKVAAEQHKGRHPPPFTPGHDSTA
jgi:hypothetical protein